MTIQGLRDTTNFVTDQRPKNWREGILLLYPNGTAALLALTALMKKRVVDDPEYNWWDKQLPTRRLVLNEPGGLLVGDNDPIVTAGALQLKAGDLIYFEETGEIVRVNSDPTVDTTFNCTRDWPNLSNGATIDSDAAGVNPNIFVIGSAYEEGSDAPTGVNFDPVKRSNYTQIFRNTLEITRTASKTRLRTGDQVREARRECLEIHSVDMEKAFWFGAKRETTVNSKPARSCDGVVRFIDSGNVIDHAGADVTLKDLEDWMEQAFRYGSSEKMGFTGNIGMLSIQRAIRKNTTWQIVSGIKEFGMNVSRIITPFGELVLKVHPLFNQITGGTTTAVDYFSVNSWLFMLDMQEFTFVNFEGADTQYQQKLQNNGLDSMKSGYLTEGSLEVHHPLSHMLIKNMGGGAVDA